MRLGAELPDAYHQGMDEGLPLTVLMVGVVGWFFRASYRRASGRPKERVDREELLWIASAGVFVVALTAVLVGPRLGVLLGDPLAPQNVRALGVIVLAALAFAAVLGATVGAFQLPATAAEPSTPAEEHPFRDAVREEQAAALESHTRAPSFDWTFPRPNRPTGSESSRAVLVVEPLAQAAEPSPSREERRVLAQAERGPTFQRRRALRKLWNLPLTPSVREAQERALSDPAREIRYQAEVLQREASRRERVTRLRELLKSDVVDVRRGAMRALGVEAAGRSVDPQLLLEAAIDGLRDPDRLVRADAAQILEYTSGEAIDPLLEAYRVEQDRTARAAIERALVRLSPSIGEAKRAEKRNEERRQAQEREQARRIRAKKRHERGLGSPATSSTSISAPATPSRPARSSPLQSATATPRDPWVEQQRALASTKTGRGAFQVGPTMAPQSRELPSDVSRLRGGFEVGRGASRRAD